MPFAQARRLLHINRVLTRYGLDEIVPAVAGSWPGRFMRLLALRRVPAARRPRGERIRLALEELGPMFVKFGQILSTRRDLLPRDIADQLALLQDQVAPFPGEEARAIIEKAYGRSVDAVFAQFSVEPLASASIAQVHAATLKDGTRVVVKVLRPGVRAQINRDLRLLYAIARFADRYLGDENRYRPLEFVDEIERTILAELDLKREGANASVLRRNFESSDALYIPEVCWDYTNRDALVLEHVGGIPIDDVTRLHEAGVNMQRLAERGVELFYTQVFRDNFFHADMHPGNILVDASDPESPRYVALDFGIVGTLAPLDQRYLAENFLAFFDRKYRRVAELHIDAGWVPADTRVDQLEAEVRTVCEPLFSRRLGEISFGEVLGELFMAARKFNLRLQPQLILLQKTLLNIEGLGRQLYPGLDIWQTAKPVLERVMRDRTGPGAAWRELRERFPIWVEKAPEIPDLVYDVLQRVNQGRLQLRLSAGDLAALERQRERRQRRQALATFAAALLVAGALLLGADGFRPAVRWAVSGALGALGLVAFAVAWRRGS